MKIPLHKIKQYSFKQLIVILFYRIIFIVLTKFEYIKMFYCSEYKFPKQEEVQVSNCYKSIIDKINDYFNYCSFNIETIEYYANRIVNGELTVLGYTYNFNYNTDWLKDPVSGNFWSSTNFWSKSSFVQDNCSDVKYVLELNKLNHLVLLALAFYRSKDEKYLYRIEVELRSWIKCVPKNKSVVNRITMDIGFRCLNLIQISILCGENVFFRNNIHPLIIGILKSHESRMRIFSTSRWFKAENENNHVIGEMVGLIITQIWLQIFENKDHSKYIVTHHNYLEKTIIKTISKSGVYLEQSASYSRLVAEFLIIYDLFSKAFIRGYLKEIKWSTFDYYFRNLLQYINVISYNNTLPNFGDNDNARVLLPFVNNKDSIEYLKKYYDSLHVKNATNNTNNIYNDGSQWLFKSNDDLDIQLFSRVGQFAYYVEGSYIHAHNDLLSVLLFAKGYSIFIDKGCLFYNSGYDTKLSYVKTEAHNTISIEKSEQSEILSTGFANYPNSCSYDTIYPYIFDGDISYKDSTIYHRRKIKYLDSLLEIEDEISTHSIHGKINFLLSENVKPNRINNNVINLEIENNFIAKIVFDTEVSCKIIEEDYHPHYGETIKTKKIVGSFSIHQKKQLITKIYF